MVDQLMDNDQSPEDMPRGKRRHFTLEQKQKLLEEAEASSYLAVAKKYNIGTNMLYAWEKKLHGKDNISEKSILMSNEYKKSLAVLERFKIANLRIATKLALDLQAGKIPTYNGVIAHSNLTATTCKVESQRLEILEKLNSAIQAEKSMEKNQIVEDSEEERQQERLAEQLLVLHAKRQCGVLTVDELNKWCQGNGLGRLC